MSVLLDPRSSLLTLRHRLFDIVGMIYRYYAGVRLLGCVHAGRTDDPSPAGLPLFWTADAVDGKQIVEGLGFMDNAKRLCRYTNVRGLGVTDYTGTFDLKPEGSGSSVEWRVEFLADSQPNIIVKTIVATLMKTGFEALTKRFGALK